MASYISFHLRYSEVEIEERFEKDSRGEKYAELHVEQTGTGLTIFLDKRTAKKLLDVVRRIDKGLNQCQKQ